jgi:uncharacterized integral membrane protein (TIGR00698 family)
VVSPAISLVLGILVVNVTGHPFLHLNHKITQRLLQTSVIGLGFGLNFENAVAISSESLGFTIGTIVFTLATGTVIGKIFSTDRITSYLISCATSICGGSAVAAVAPVVKANENQISLSLASVFILNGIALLIFPLLGTWLHMSQQDFGTWCAVAIHDTSSVVGAASRYGAQALLVATTVKLSRALFIIPLTLVTSLVYRSTGTRIRIPWFILFFTLASLVNTFVPEVSQHSETVVRIARSTLAVTLFLVGAGMDRHSILKLGYRPFLQALLLWVLVAASTLAAILFF